MDFGKIKNKFPVKKILKNVEKLFLMGQKLKSKTKQKNQRKSTVQFWHLQTTGIKENEISNYGKFANAILLSSEKRCKTKLSFKKNYKFLIDHYDLFKKPKIALPLRYNDTFREQKELLNIEKAINSIPIRKSLCRLRKEDL